jgi:hypothetical protein
VLYGLVVLANWRAFSFLRDYWRWSAMPLSLRAAKIAMQEEEGGDPKRLSAAKTERWRSQKYFFFEGRVMKLWRK